MDQNQEGQVLFVNKPYEWTSFDVVKKLRGALKVRKIGHAGTLDPLATGLLILCTGKKTKEIETYQNMEKEYNGTMVLGKTTPSFDLETDFDSQTSIAHLEQAQVMALTSKFLGNIQQVPPIFSAVKIDGKRVYKKARRGEKVQLNPRTVTINEFEIIKCELPEVHFRVVCSKGTYIRSLVRDFGEALGVGAYLSALQRTRIGPYTLENAHHPENLVQSRPN